MDARSAGGSGGGSPSSPPPPPPGGGETVYSQLADMLLEGVESGGLGGLDLEEEGGSGEEEDRGDAGGSTDGMERSVGGVEQVSGEGAAIGASAGAADSGSGGQPSSSSAASSSSISQSMHPSRVPPTAGGGGPRQRLLQGLEMNAGRMAELINHFRLEGRGAEMEEGEFDPRDGGPQNSSEPERGSNATGEQTRQGRGRERGRGAAGASSNSSGLARATGAARRKTRPKRK